MKVSPSILTCDFAHAADEVRFVADSGADMVHLDVMDGVFVPNISFGFPVIEAIAKKAEQTALDGALSRISVNESAIQTLNETTIPANNTEIGKKANSADVYTKTEIDNITGTVPADKTLVGMIGEAQAAATYNDSEVRGLISDNKTAIESIWSPVEKAKTYPFNGTFSL